MVKERWRGSTSGGGSQDRPQDGGSLGSTSVEGCLNLDLGREVWRSNLGRGISGSTLGGGVSRGIGWTPRGGVPGSLGRPREGGTHTTHTHTTTHQFTPHNYTPYTPQIYHIYTTTYIPQQHKTTPKTKKNKNITTYQIHNHLHKHNPTKAINLARGG